MNQKFLIRAVLAILLTTSAMMLQSASAAPARATASPDSTSGSPDPNPPQRPGNTIEQDKDQARAEFDRQARIAANKQRQQELKRDTDKLLQLATDLKASVDKSNENILSLDVIKKAEQIEKLAKSVKDKMKSEN